MTRSPHLSCALTVHTVKVGLDSQRHNEKHEEFKSMLRANKTRYRIVRMDTGGTGTAK